MCFCIHNFNFFYLQVKPTEVSSSDLNALCQTIQEKFFDIPSPSRSIFNDLEVCIGGNSSSTLAEKAAEISLSREMIVTVGQWLGNVERVQILVSTDRDSCGAFGVQLSEQLLRDGMNTSLQHLRFIFILNQGPALKYRF